MLRVLHIVRRFGPVGGMERYVWRLTHELSELGVQVEVLCETLEGESDHRIRVHRVSRSTNRRRWRAMRDFRASCADFWLAYPDKSNLIVHSHERSIFHHVTTFHGPPIGESLIKSPWWKSFQPRIKAWLRFEQEELCGPQVGAVIPVSSMISSSLHKIYPAVAGRMKMPGWPALDLSDKKDNVGDGQKLLFVGREWKRKGLDIVIDAYTGVREKHPSVTLDIFGVLESALPRSLRVKSHGVTFHGWQSVIPFELYDVLVHPARYEPFGMVIPEARAAGLSVVMSNKVGASDLALSHVKVIDINSECSVWSDAIIDGLYSAKSDPEICWTWTDLAKWHVTDVYQVI